MPKLYNLARQYSTTTGTGSTVALDGAAVPKYLTWSGAGALNGETVWYGILDGSNSEVGLATYSSSGPSLTNRTVLKSTNADAPLNLTGAQEVFSTALAEALNNLQAPQGRITLATGTKVMTASVAGATTVYYTPARGNLIPIYDGSSFRMRPFTELAQAANDTGKSPAATAASSVYDLFVWDDAGTLRCTRGPAWTNSSTRGYTLTEVNGITLNTSAISNGPGALRGTWVGTVASNASSTFDYIFGAAASGGTAGFLGVWNAYNQEDVATMSEDSGASYTYASGTIRQARASAGNQITFVCGRDKQGFDVSVGCEMSNPAANSAPSIGIGFNSTTTYTGSPYAYQSASSATFAGVASAQLRAALGLNVISRNEATLAATITFNAHNQGGNAFVSVRLRN